MSTTWIGSSSGDGIASGCTMIDSGMPLDASNSPVCGIVLIVDRMYRGLQHPRSTAMKLVDAAGGCAAAPCCVRESHRMGSAWGSCAGRGICAGSMRWPVPPPPTVEPCCLG